MTIWQEGDIVGPTNLNNKVPSWFGSANTNSSASSVINGIANVKDYGAFGDRSTDDWAAIQSAISTALNSASQNSTPIVYLPTGWYNHSQPFELAEGFQAKVFGAGRVASTVIEGTYAYGPEFVIASGYTIPITTNLLSGGTNALTYDNSVNRWFNLRDAPTMDVNGLTAFTMEATYNPASFADNYQLFTSSGRALGCDPVTQAFGLRTDASGGATAAVRAWICTNASNKTITSAATGAVGTAYHLALSWGGSVATLYVNGTSVGTSTVTGTLTQGPMEDVTVGPSMNVNPEAGVFQTGLKGTIDSIRFSDIARYGANFTAPSAKFSNDSNTLMLMNFEKQSQLCSLARTKTGDAWLWMRQANASGHIDWYFKDFELECGNGRSGILGFNAQLPHVDNVRIQHYRHGIFLNSNSFEGRFQDLYLLTSSVSTVTKYGIVIAGTSGVQQFDSVNIEGAEFPVVVVSSGVQFNNPFIVCDGFTRMGMLFNDSSKAASAALVGPIFSTEVGASSAFSGSLVVSGMATLTSVGGVYQSFNTVAPVLVDNTGTMTFVGDYWSPLNLSYPLVAVSQTTRMPTRPIVLVNPSFSTTPLSMSTQAGLVCLVGADRSAISSAGATLAAPFYSLGTTNSSGNSANLVDGELRLVAVSTTSAELAVRSGNTTYRFIAAATAV